MKKLFLLLIPLIFIVNSCSSQKKVLRASGEAERQALVSFYSNYKKNIPDFDAMQIRSKINTDLNGKSLSASLRLYIKNGERIWANASVFGITGARANITLNKVQAYNVLEKEYIDSDFEYFNDILKVNFINYKRLQELLLGQLFLIKDLNDYDLKVSDNQYVLSYKQNKTLEQKPPKPKKNEYIHTFYLDSNYRLRKVDIIDPISGTDITATYDEWQLLDGKNFPSLVKVLINGKQKDKIELDYTNFVFEDAAPPFRIPKGYTEKIIK